MKNKVILFLAIGPIAAVALTVLIMKINKQETPSTIEESWTMLEEHLDPEVLAEIKNDRENTASKMLSTYGVHIKKRWIQNGDPKFIRFFQSLGVESEDRIALIILDSFQKHLQNKPVNIEKIAEYYKKR